MKNSNAAWDKEWIIFHLDTNSQDIKYFITTVYSYAAILAKLTMLHAVPSYFSFATLTLLFPFIFPPFILPFPFFPIP